MIKKSMAILLAVTAVIIPVSASASSTTFDIANGDLVFSSPTTEVLSAATAATPAFRYTDVFPTGAHRIDALVSIVSLLNSESNMGLEDDKMDEIDNADTFPAMDVYFRSYAADHTQAQVIFDVQFVAAGTSTPVKLQNVKISVSDIDNNQFVQFSGLSDYRMQDVRGPTDVQAYTGSASFTSILRADRTPPGTSLSQSMTVPAGSVLFFAQGSNASDDTATQKGQHMVEVTYSELETLRVMLGTFENGGASFGIEFNLNSWFSSDEFTDAGLGTSPITVNRPSFTKSYDVNTGSGTVPSSVTGSGALTVSGSTSSPGITKSGFNFAGWNTRADGTGVSYAPGSSILPVADLTLYAVWTAIQSSPAPEGSASTAQAPATVLAATGVSNSYVLGILAGSSALLVAFGLVLLNPRRRIN